MINSLDDIAGVVLLFVVVVVSIIDDEEGTLSISGKCEIESTTIFDVVFGILFVVVTIFV